MINSAKAEAWNQLKEKINRLPFYPHLGMKIIDLQDGYCRIEMQVTAQVQTTRQSLHGGAIAAVMDCANAMAANASYVGEGLVVTTSMTIHFVRPGLGDSIVAEGRVVYKGQSQAFTEATIHDAVTAKLIAKSSATCLVKVVGTYDKKDGP